MWIAVLSLVVLLAGCTGDTDTTRTGAYGVAGRVVDEQGNGLGGVVIEFSSTSDQVTTDEQGLWAYNGLIGTAVIRASKEGWTFRPDFYEVSKDTLELVFTGEPLSPGEVLTPELVLYELFFFDRQIKAVIGDMEVYVLSGALAGDESLFTAADIEAAASVAIDRLAEIAEGITPLKGVNAATDEIADGYLAFLDRLVQLLTGIHEKGEEEILAGWEEFEALYQATLERQVDVLLELDAVASLVDSLDFSALWGFPENGFLDVDLDKQFTRVRELVAEGDYKEAFDLLESLRAGMREADPAYGYILIGLSDIVGKAIYTGYSYWFDEVTRWTDTLDAPAYLIDYPQRVMEGGFSPLYAEAFLRWRTNYQWLNHGVSNWSSIPNWEYNQRMETMLARAKERLQGNDAVEARVEILELLIGVTNISRGPFGNSVLVDLYRLYSNE